MKKAESEEEMKLNLVKQIKLTSYLQDADHTLIHIEDHHYKFYQIKRVGARVEICYGKIGSNGNHFHSYHVTTAAAKKVVESTLRSKLRKGYEEPVQVVTKYQRKAPKKKLTADGLAKLDVFLSTLNGSH